MLQPEGDALLESRLDVEDVRLLPLEVLLVLKRCGKDEPPIALRQEPSKVPLVLVESLNYHGKKKSSLNLANTPVLSRT